jgi:hypothetical protein
MEADRNAFWEVFMIPLSSAVSQGLIGSKLPHSQDYELTLNNEVVGTLRRPSLWSTNFVAETQNGRWTFVRGGFLGTGAEILQGERPIASFKASWSGKGVLTFADGQTFHVECKGWWHPVWSMRSETGQPIVQIHTREKAVDVPAGSSVANDRLSLLIMFAWYRVLQSEEDAAAAATVAVIAS